MIGNLMLLIGVGFGSLWVGYVSGMHYARYTFPKWEAEQEAKQEEQDKKEYERLKRKYDKC